MVPVGKLSRPGFLKIHAAEQVLRRSTAECCRFCTNADISPAKPMHKNLRMFLESKAAFTCFDLVVPPALNYVTAQTMASPEMIRFLLGSVHVIKDVRKRGLVKELLTHHLTLHPPCRPGMSAFYSSLMYEPLASQTFSSGQISDTFFDLFQRLQSVVDEFVLLASPKKSSVPDKDLRKAALDFLQQQARSTPLPNQASVMPQISELMFVFDYCVDILVHDYEKSVRAYDVPALVEKIVWGHNGLPGAGRELNAHCHDVMKLLLKVPPRYCQSVARYLTLLAEVMQQVNPTDDCVWPLGTFKMVDAFVEKFLDSEDPVDNVLRYICSFPPKFRYQFEQSLIYHNLIRGAPAKFPKY